jgi:hypothetical protein
MTWKKTLPLVLCLMAWNFDHIRGSDTQHNNDFFETSVRPFWAEKCYPCHTASEMGNLRLDSKERLLRGGKTGPAVVPGDPENSLLVQAITGWHERLKMPPADPLKEVEISILTKWVQVGAFWPDLYQNTLPPLLHSGESM